MSSVSSSAHMGGGPPHVSKVSDTCLKRAKGLFRGWKAILRHHRCPKDVIEDCRRQILGYLLVEEGSTFLKRAKYIGTMYMAWFLKNDLPEIDSQHVFVHTGRWRGWARSRRFMNRRNLHMWYSLLQAKRCALPLSKDMVLATYEGHRAKMSLEDPIDKETLESVFNGLLGVLEPVRKALTSAYRSDESLETLSETTWTPSSAACFEASRKVGGQKGHVTDVASVAAAELEAHCALRKGLARLIENGDVKVHEHGRTPLEETELETNWYESNPGWEDVVEGSPTSEQDDGMGTRVSMAFRRAQPGIHGLNGLPTTPTLVRMQFFPKVTVNGRVLLNHIVEFYEYSHEDEIWDESLADAILTINTGRAFRCEIYGILEPLKVRVISKGEGLPYYASKELQKRLHAILRKMDCFRLIGRPLCPTDLMDCVQHQVQGVDKEEKKYWYSVDYSSATDCLSASLSKRILEHLTQDLPARMREIFIRVLAPHECHYPPMKVKKGTAGSARHYDERCMECELTYVRLPDGTFGDREFECKGKTHLIVLPPVQQKNGQLMGSPLSFPILCLANLGLYLEVIKSDTRPLWQKLKGVLVNGDDMLYVAPSQFWDRHVQLGRTVGLEMTPGKAYMHRSFANANSTCFVYDLADHEPGFPDQVRSTPWQVDFFNTGLYFGQNKVLQKDTSVDQESPTYKVSVINQLLKGALPGRQKSLLKGYLSRHRLDIQKECQGRNLFIASSLGGMGVDRPLGWKWQVTDQQRVHAAALAQEAGAFACFGGGPSFGPVLEEPRQKVSPWWVDTSSKVPPRLRKSYWVSKNETFLKNSLLEHGFRVVGFRQPSWRRNFYNSSAIERTAARASRQPWEFCDSWLSTEPLDTELGDDDVVIYDESGVISEIRRSPKVTGEVGGITVQGGDRA